MQSKLNEILELCIEKSGGRIFYAFHYNVRAKMIMIEKTNDIGSNVKFKNHDASVIILKVDHDIDKALEYMQNE